MKIIVQEYGTKITKNGNCLCINNSKQKKMICSDQIEEIHLCPSCSISTDAVALCAEKNIWILCVDKFRNPNGEFLPFSQGCSPIYKRKQLLLAYCEEGIEIVKGFLEEKIDNRIKQLKKFLKNRKKEEVVSFLKQRIEMMENELEKIQEVQGRKISAVRGSLQGYEGAAGRAYFECISLLLPDELQFTQRQRNACDLYNCTLNYLYGMLYAKIKNVAYKCRLDPYIGIMHVDSYNKPTFVYDFIESERIICEELAFEICKDKKLVMEDMEEIQPGVWRFKTEPKRVLIESFYAKLKEPCIYKRKTMRIEERISKRMLETALKIEQIPDVELFSA